MAIAFLGRTLAFRTAINLPISSGFSRSFKFSSISLPKIVRKNCSSPALALRSLLALPDLGRIPAIGVRCFSTRPTTSSLNDPSPNWSNRPPKETILLDGCDFEHWLVVMEPPQGNPTRDEIIDSYIKTLAQVVGSEEEARMKIYSVSTKHYYAFGCLVSEELSYKIKPLPNVRWVLPDSYLDVKNKDYGGEPFIDGKAVPYDPKYHEEWVRNNARANERSRRNDRPRNFDRSRNFERRRENMQNRDFQNRDMPPMPNQDFQNRGVQNSMPGGDMPNRDLGPNRDHMNRDMPNPGSIPNRDYQSRDMPNPGSMPNRDYRSRDMPNPGSMPNRDYQSRDMPNPGSMPNRDYQSRDMPNPGSMPNRDYQSRDMPNPGSMPNRDYQSRDMPRMGGMPNREYPTMDRPNMGSTPNRDYPSRDMPNREMGGVAGGDHQNMPSSNYLGRDMPGINYQGGDIPSSNYQGRDVPPMPNREY